MVRWCTAFIIGLFSLCITAPSSGQLIKVDPKIQTGIIKSPYVPGVLHNPRNTEGTKRFRQSPYQYPLIKSRAIEGKLQQSDSLGGFRQSLTDVRSELQRLDDRTDRLMITIHRMPEWLSDSTDTTMVGPDFRFYEGYSPKNDSLWRSLVQSVGDTLEKWGLHPYYEIWNQPDQYAWQDSTTAYYELFRMTARTLQQADSLAKIGGPAVRWWTNGLNCKTSDWQGMKNDSLVEQCALLSSLVDSVVSWDSVDLQFLSWQHFFPYFGEIEEAAEFTRQKIDSAGLDSVEQIISGWNVPEQYRDSVPQNPLFVTAVGMMNKSGIDAHSITAWQDTQHHDQLEFYRGQGVVSDGGLLKPSWKGIDLLNQLGGKEVLVQTKDPIWTKASIIQDTLELVISNQILSPYEEAREELLYHHSVNTYDLDSAGYERKPQIDSVFRGLIQPWGPKYIKNAFKAAQDVYDRTDSLQHIPRSIRLQVADNANLKGLRYLIDSAKNNIIARYDSLRQLGYNREQSVSLLKHNQDLKAEDIQMNNAIYSFQLPPNGIAYLKFADVSTSISALQESQKQGFSVHPNPTSGTVRLSFFADKTAQYSVSLHHVTGKKVVQKDFGKRQTGDHEELLSLNRQNLSPGVYLLRLHREGRPVGLRKVVFNDTP